MSRGWISRPVKALDLEVDGSKKEQRDGKEVLKYDMIARGLQRLNAQDRERWQPCCKNRLPHACGENLMGFRNRRLQTTQSHSWSIMMMKNVFYAIAVKYEPKLSPII